MFILVKRNNSYRNYGKFVEFRFFSIRIIPNHEF